ncbi:DUF262 domain-containing protein [Flavivirga eckloniae]|uniref:GmrSD restriction endonucleases N-terminal domain-containing protein n=1 Tax=Flavivirga eckloniae TaxID=1803846 RepID=A0A2K9PNI2_9FLAO|nr:DUF262 domain-containing protein [Flavivirga eckloniae]AUP78388.1 hypothetical protein C1H87_06555 [Flavivirga eckloniae]
MGQFRDVSIKNVIEDLNQSYFLPDIQREYVWLRKAKEKKIEQLFDSILRGYPIGSFLFWKLKKDDIETNKDAKEDSEKLNFQLYKFIENYDERKTHNEKVNIEQINSDDLSIVLDGQQRLTSLYIGLKGTRTLKKPKAWWDNPNAFEEKQLFLNLRYQPNEENPDDNFDFDFLRKNTIPKIDENNYWFKIGDILELGSIVSYAREKNLSDNEAEILEKLKDAFCTKSLISYFEETEKNLDKVLKIFIRVNSGGTQLSYSDLLMSILTANFSTDIRDVMNKFVDSLKEQGFGVMGRDQVLKTCLLLTESNHIFQLKNFSKSNINKIEDNWEGITETIFKATKLLKEFGYTNQLSSAYILSAVAYYIFKKKNIVQEDKTELLKFVRNAQITSYFTTSLDGKLEVVAKIIRTAENFKMVNNKLAISKVQPLKISRDDIDRMMDFQYGNPAILPILQILYPDLDYKNSTFHIDHIYPKSKFKPKNTDLDGDYLTEANFLYNLQLLQGEENLAKKAKNPEIWLGEHFSNNEEQIKAYKRRNYIDENCELNWGGIKEFNEYRTEKIKAKLKEILLTEKEIPVLSNV